MPPKSSLSATNLTNTTTVIPDLLTSHLILAPNEYSPATIGIQNCLLRCCEPEHFARYFHQTTIIGLRTKDIIHRLNEMEKRLKNDYQINIERSPMITRLLLYLRTNENEFQNILDCVKKHLEECMRDDAPLSSPQTYDEFIQQCHHRNQAAFEYDKVSRMRRFEFHDQKDIKQPINLINLQTWTQQHFNILVNNINPGLSNHDQLLTELTKLLDNSFFIIQHPSRVATHSPPKNDTVTANINCRLLCLLDKSDSAITIDSIIPFIHCLTRSNPTEENDVSYQQAQMNWTTYSLVTSSNNQRIFSCTDLSEIVLNPTSAVPQRQQPPAGKARYAPYLYRVNFQINITIRFPNGQSSKKHCVIVQSTPFGLITNTSQEEELFARVFVEHLKCWKSMPSPTLTTVSNIPTSPSTMIDLTVQDIVHSIQRYFIHKTGIYPKPWIMPYIKKQLNAAFSDDANWMQDRFYDILTKILAQIDFMTKHPLLILFHADGLFFGICDSKSVDQVLLLESNRSRKVVCAIRFGSIQNITDIKNICVRVDLVDKSFTHIKYCTFAAEKLSMELGSFIIRIALDEASCFENIMYNITKNAQQQLQIDTKNIRVVADLYDSDKIRELCPHEQKYSPIWMNFDSKENKRPKNFNPSSTSRPPQNFKVITTSASTNENAYCRSDITYLTVNQSQQIMQTNQLQYSYQPQYNPQPQQQYNYSSLQAPAQFQPVDTTFSGTLQPSTTSSNTPENNQQRTNLTSVIVVYAPANQPTMSDCNVVTLISEHFPQYSSSIPFGHIHHLNLNSFSQSSNTPVQVLQDSCEDLMSPFLSSDQNMIYETYLMNSPNLPESANNN